MTATLYTFTRIDGKPLIVNSDQIHYLTTVPIVVGGNVSTAGTLLHVNNVDYVVLNQLTDVTNILASSSVPLTAPATSPTTTITAYPVVKGSVETIWPTLTERRYLAGWTLQNSFDGINYPLMLQSNVHYPYFILQRAHNYDTDLPPYGYPQPRYGEVTPTPRMFLIGKDTLPFRTDASIRIPPYDPIYPVPNPGITTGSPFASQALDVNIYSNTGSSFVTVNNISTASTNEIVVVFGEQVGSNGAVTISDGLSSSWTTKINTSIGGGSARRHYMFYTVASSRWSNNSITLNGSNSLIFNIISVTNCNTTTPFDVTADSLNSSLVSITTSKANDFVFGFIEDLGSGTLGSVSPYTILEQDLSGISGSLGFLSEYQVVSTTGTYQLSLGSSGNYSANGSMIGALQHS